MNERVRKRILVGFSTMMFFMGIVFIVVGQQNVGYNGLIQEIIGLILLLILLWMYNLSSEG